MARRNTIVRMLRRCAEWLPVPKGKPRVHYASAFRSEGGPAVKLQLLRERFGDHAMRFNLLYLMSAGKPDFDMVERAKRRGVKVVLNQNGTYFPAVRPDDWEAANEPMRRMIALADVVLYQSAFCKHAADRFLGEAPAEQDILLNGVDTDFFCPSSERQKGPVRLLTTAVVNNEYMMVHFEFLMRSLVALRQLRSDWLMQCAGCFRTKPFAERALKMIEDLGLVDVVKLTVPFRRERAPLVYRRAEVYLHCKTNDWCPNAVLEAMASGLPVVFCEAGGTKKLVGSRAGVGVESPIVWDYLELPDANAYAEAVSTVIDKRVTMRTEARRRAVNRFSLSRWLDKHASLFERLLSKEAP